MPSTAPHSLTRRMALLSGAATLAACAATPAPEPAVAAAPAPLPTEADLIAFLDAAFDARVARNPQFATQIGDKRGYDRWGDPTEAFALNEVALAGAATAEMEARFAHLSGDLSMRLFADQGRRLAENTRWFKHFYVFNQMYGAQTTAPVFLINNHRVAAVSDAEALVARITGLGGYMDAQVANSETARAAGVLPPRFVYDAVIPAARAIISGAPFDQGPDSPLWADLKKKVSALDASAPKAELLAAGRAALIDQVQPAYQRLLRTLADQARAAGTDDGVWRLPDGEAFYAARLKAQTTTTLTAEEIHQIGLDNVARLKSEMQAVMKEVKFKGDLDQFFTFMETDKRFFLPDTEEGKARYISLASDAIAAMMARAPQYFNLMPRAKLEVRAVEKFREGSAGLAFYQSPAADGSRPGYYYANTADMQALPLYQLEALAYHEGAPGHHFQRAVAQELQGIPRFRRFGLGYTAYTEGWGLYSERLAKDMGFYADAYADFGRLTLEIRRAIRLVVDTGLHAKRWTREDAVQYLLANQPGDRAQAVKDISRYIVMPGQATAYMIGQREILRLREEARAAMGPRFNMPSFHDIVLGGGELPLDILAAEVRAWAGA